MPRLSHSYGNTQLALEQVRQQTNQNPLLLKLGNNNSLPRDMKLGDTVIQLHQRGALIVLPGDRGQRQFIIPANSAQNQGTLEGTGLPTIDAFPEDGDYGWWIDQTAGKAYWSINVDGTIYYTTSTVGGINFTEISGTITDAQHGNLGRATGGNPHHTNATTTQPGFLSTTFFDRLNNATASATASTLVLRNGSAGANFGDVTVADLNGTNGTFTNTISATVSVSSDTFDAQTNYQVSGVQVVSGRDTGWATQTATPSKADLGATPTAAQIAQYLSALDAALQTHGLIGA